MKKYKIIITPEADNDILDIYFYVALNDSINKAENLLEKIEVLCYSLEHFPERGHISPELHRLSINAYREIHFKFYRIIYQIISNNIYVHCVLDSRRDLEYVLLQRLIKT